MIRAITLVGLLCAWGAALAQSPVAPGVDSVISGGYWEASGRSGHYRVIVINEGFEHVTSRVLVQWLAGSENGEPTIVATSEPKPFGDTPVSFRAKIKFISKGRLRISLSGVIPYGDFQKVTSVMIAESPGQVVVTAANPLVQPTRKKPRAANQER